MYIKKFAQNGAKFKKEFNVSSRNATKIWFKTHNFFN